MSTLLQIVPKFPGGLDGVGDYAWNLAHSLHQRARVESIFAAREEPPATPPPPFNHLRLPDDLSGSNYDAAILHYVNYGFDPGGLPRWLPQVLCDVRKKISGKYLVIFHELFASGPPWRRAFWSQGEQKKIASEIANAADECVVSNPVSAGQLRQLCPSRPIAVQPTPSTLGEPEIDLAALKTRDPHRWVICGGTALLERSLRSFVGRINRVPVSARPRELFLLGGIRNARIPPFAARLADLKTTYLPEIAAAEASRILSVCSYGWIDYFGDRSAAILKSSSFAALCAHAVVPVFPGRGQRLAVSEDPLPPVLGPDLLQAHERAEIAERIYRWYHRHASLARLTERICNLLGYARCR
jgi:hypothetical protein